MIKKIMQLSTPMKLALLAAVLGVIALIAGSSENRAKVSVNLKDLALSKVNEQDRIHVTELADMLIKETSDFTLIDLRPAKDFAVYAIPTAVNIQPENIYSAELLRTQKLFLYADDDITSAQVWYMLKSDRYQRVYIVSGGMKSWKNDVLYPSLRDSASADEKAAFEKVRQVSLHFGGSPRIISGGTVVAQAPEVKSSPFAPPVKAGGSSPAGGKKKKEGC